LRRSTRHNRENEQNKPNYESISEDIRPCILELFESVNNTHAKINLHNPNDVNTSNDIRKLIRELLYDCGVLDSNEDTSLDMEYDMDCSRDEEIARQLAATNIDDDPPDAVPRQRRMRTRHE
jgi:hypothetical protein